ncbi:hypothetical protein TCAL_05810 [Tigriopus californicus]|uniref:PIPK domain-containing protein n=1 Tax=Tigriopus californicus TaxID=6832 RepID=A0A553PNI9_TIGCA|nr:phosphatidylinositol 4-phosphate 5-kinase type-1 alpha-like [Tigriopus californicus]TRY79248.1 hypothetical protein TCAL_05810 [Tigriopus californicus]
MPNQYDASLQEGSNENGTRASVPKTIISLNAFDEKSDLNHYPDGITDLSENLGPGGDGSDCLQVRSPVARTISNRSSTQPGVPGAPGHPVKGKKIGHRRVKREGPVQVVTYKRFETGQLMGSVQLGLHQSIGSLAKQEDRDLLMKDFLPIVTVSFTKDGVLEKTPAHNYSEFRFRSYAPFAFKKFRQIFEIEERDFLVSLCSEPMFELSNPGASGSIFYITLDDKFICKTVQHKEADFLRELLPGYSMNLKQNPRTLLPKFFGLYCYSVNAKNVRIIIMNNLLPSDLKMHHRFDLKGSTYKRKASRTERAKGSPTFKDLDFLEMYPEGILLQPELYDNLMNSIERDCRVLESFKIMDYSLLIGIHNLDMAAKEEGGEGLGGAGSENTSLCGSDVRGGIPPLQNQQSMLERQGSIVMRDRPIAHTTALESITMEVDPSDDEFIDETDVGPEVKNVWGGIPAKNHRGDNLLLFIGIIDILQSYRLLKKAEHYWKSLFHDGDTVSVHRPSFYAKRFQTFIGEKVFRKMPSNLKPTLSFRRSNYRRTLSKDIERFDGMPNVGSPNNAAISAQSPGSQNNSNIIPDPAQSSSNQDNTVTVIKIGDEVNLPSILQDRRKQSPPTHRRDSKVASNQQHLSKTPQNRAEGQRRSSNAAASTVNNALPHQNYGSSLSPTPSPGMIRTPGDDRLETGSIITMTSDERVQIYVPSPQTTPYNTITKNHQESTQIVKKVPWGRDDATPPPFTHRTVTAESSSYRSITPLNSATGSSRFQSRLVSSSMETSNSTRVVTEETSVDMVKISISSSSTADGQDLSTAKSGRHLTSSSSEHRTLMDDLPSLPADESSEHPQYSNHQPHATKEPLSLSDILLEVDSSRLNRDNSVDQN